MFYEAGSFGMVCYVMPPVDPIVLNPLSHLHRCNVGSLIRYYVLWDSAPLNQTFWELQDARVLLRSLLLNCD